MQHQLANMAKTDWIKKAKESTDSYIHCFIPVITLSYMHDVHPLNRNIHVSFKTFIDNGGINTLKNQLKKANLKVLYSSTDIVSTLVELQEGDVSIETQFLNKERNIFVIDISDSVYAYKSIIIVCEYNDAFDPLANHTVDYEVVEQYKKKKQSAANFIKHMQKTQTDDSIWD